MIRFLKATLEKTARNRPDGWLADVMASARHDDAESITLHPDDYAAIQKKYGRRLRLGDLVESVAKPIAQAIDFVFKTDLQNCKGCEERKEWLNGER
jgi:hypothetical protein